MNNVNSVATTDYYLYDAFGRNLGVRRKVGSSADKWEFYVFGNRREAKYIKNVGNGIVDPDELEFYLTDHLGNTRMVYSLENGSSGIALSMRMVADYFPYGKVLRQFSNPGAGGNEKFLSTDHERDPETDWDYRGARYYDSDVARFLSLDPLAAKFPGWSPYSYSFCNPISFTDPTGKEPEKVGSGPGDRYRRLSAKGSLKAQRRASSLLEKVISSDAKKGNNGTKAPEKIPNYGRGGGNMGDNTLLGNTFEYHTYAGNPVLNRIGFKAVTIDDGQLNVIQVGYPEPGTLRPMWTKGNSFNQTPGTYVEVDDQGNIMDNNTGQVLIPIPVGVDPSDGLYATGEEMYSRSPSGEVKYNGVADVDKVVRIQQVIKLNPSGVAVDVSGYRRLILNESIITENP